MQPASWTLGFDAPDVLLNANQRKDRRRAAGTVRAWREAACMYARAAHVPSWPAAHLVIAFHFTDRKRRDVHNYYPTAKAVVDGLVDAGLIPDDQDRYLLGPDLRAGHPVRGVARLSLFAVRMERIRPTAAVAR